MFAGGTTVAEHLELLKGNPFARFGTHLVVGPMYHTGPLSGFRLLAVGVPVVILGRFDAEATLAAIDHWKAESSGYGADPFHPAAAAGRNRSPPL